MISVGVPYEAEQLHPDTTTVFSFPMKSPDKAICRNDLTAIQQLELWKIYAEHWCEHKPSVTISVKEKEWVNVGAWCWNNFDELSGVSFLPHADHVYKQAPYQDVDEDDYKLLLKNMPKNIDWTKLSDVEKEDTTTGTQELACTAGACELVDITA